MPKQNAKATQEGAGVNPAPSFYRWQLMSCKALNASPDVILAVLDGEKMYTIDEARDAIKKFYERKV